MKCPQCTNTCSELRDICPHCFFDLREEKAKQDLPISYPGVPYELLLSRTKGGSALLGQELGKQGLFGGLKKIFGSSEKTSTPPSRPSPKGSVDDQPELDILWQEAQQSLAAKPRDLIEFETSSFIRLERDQNTILLFDLALAWFSDRDLLKKFAPVPTSGEKVLQSDAIESALNAIKSKSEVNLFKLKNLPASAPEVSVEAKNIMRPLRASEKIRGGIADAIVILALASFFAYLITPLTFETEGGIIFYGALCLALFLPLTALYPALMLLWAHGTIGSKMAESYLVLVDEKQNTKLPSAGLRFFRGLASPLYAVLTPFAPQALDRLAGSRFVTVGR